MIDFSEQKAREDNIKSIQLNGRVVSDLIADAVLQLGENIMIGNFKQRTSNHDGMFSDYVHGNGKIGVIIEFNALIDAALGKDIAMHIAAMKPKAITSSDVDPKLIEVEKRVASEKALEAGKTPEIMKKMVDGAVSKFLKEVSLYGQVFVKSDDNKTTIEHLLKNNQASINSFTVFTVGEGLEKKSENFAEEVAATTAAAKVH